MCPFCLDERARCQKKGFFAKTSTRAERVQRFRCLQCRRSFSAQTATLTYREKKPHVDQPLYRLLNSGVSQRRCAMIFALTRATVARKLVRLGRAARHQHQLWLTAHAPASGPVAVIDEMETLEHTKMKPLAIAVAVEEGSRLILGAAVSRMPAKGRLAERSRRKYGRRTDGRAAGLKRVLAGVAVGLPGLSEIKSDECPRYPRLFAAAFPGAQLTTHKGRRACTVGQGELKAGGFDPLFSLNHTCAMFRDNLKTLARRTWCTPKKPDRLQALIDIYVTFHNDGIESKGRHSKVYAGPIIGASF